jgi:hypothetical protein
VTYLDGLRLPRHTRIVMPTFRTLVVLTALFTATSAFAAPVDKVNKLMEAGKPDQAILLCQRFLEKAPNDSELKLAMEKAYFLYAEQIGTIDAYRGFGNRYPQGPFSIEAYNRTATMAWEAIAGTKERSEVSTYLQQFPNGPMNDAARRLETNLAFRDAQQADTVESWGKFVDLFPNDKRANEARKRMEFSALKGARAEGTVAALRKFISAYPKSTRRGAVMRDILVMGTKFTPPCAGEPPTCVNIPKGTVMSATWGDLANEKISAELVAWSEANGPSPLRAALAAWAGDGWDQQPAALADLLTGTVEGSKWTLKLPVDLRRPGSIQDGYALKIQADDAAPAVFPMVVKEVWEPPKAGRLAVYPQKHSIEVKDQGATEPRVLAAIDDLVLNDPNRSLLVGGWWYAWGDAGLARINLDTGDVDRSVRGPKVNNVWEAGGTVLFETKVGDEGALLRRYEADGSLTTVMPPPHRTNAPNTFTTVKFAQDVPVGIMFIKGHGWGWIPELTEPRPLKTPESVPAGGPKAARLVLDPPGRHAAFFIEGRSAKIVVITLDTGVAAEISVPPSKFDRRAVFWDDVSWTNDGLLGRVADSDKVAMVIGESLSIVPADAFPPPEAPERPDDAEEGSLAFIYAPQLIAALKVAAPAEPLP